MKNYKYRKVTNSNLPTCPLREEKSLSQRAFSIYTDIRKLQDKAKGGASNARTDGTKTE